MEGKIPLDAVPLPGIGSAGLFVVGLFWEWLGRGVDVVFNRSALLHRHRGNPKAQCGSLFLPSALRDSFLPVGVLRKRLADFLGGFADGTVVLRGNSRFSKEWADFFLPGAGGWGIFGNWICLERLAPLVDPLFNHPVVLQRGGYFSRPQAGKGGIKT